MPGEQNISVNSASSVENQTSVPDKLERASDETKLVEETPDTIRGQLAELFHALRTRDDSSRNFLLRVVQPGPHITPFMLSWLELLPRQARVSAWLFRRRYPIMVN